MVLNLFRLHSSNRKKDTRNHGQPLNDRRGISFFSDDSDWMDRLKHSRLKDVALRCHRHPFLAW